MNSVKVSDVCLYNLCDIYLLPESKAKLTLGSISKHDIFDLEYLSNQTVSLLKIKSKNFTNFMILSLFRQILRAVVNYITKCFAVRPQI